MMFLFSFTACDKVCSGCTGPGVDQCQSCAGGYHDSEGTCTGTADNISCELQEICSKHAYFKIYFSGKLYLGTYFWTLFSLYLSVLKIIKCPLKIYILTGFGDRCEWVFPVGSCVYWGEPEVYQHPWQLHVRLLRWLWGETGQVCPHCTARLVL